MYYPIPINLEQRLNTLAKTNAIFKVLDKNNTLTEMEKFHISFLLKELRSDLDDNRSLR